jgi:hypothetical protein
MAHGPLWPNNLHGPSNGYHQPPSSKSPPRSRGKRHTVNPRPARGHSAPSSEFPPRLRVPAPWANLRLVRGFQSLERISASFEGSGPSSESPPRSRLLAPRVNLRLAQGFRPPRAGLRLARGFPLTHCTSPAPPTGALNALICRGRLGQREILHHVDPLTPLGNLSVRNLVPTLTSNKRQGLSLNGRC